MSNSEFRQNLVSGEWAVIAPGRFKKPYDFAHDGKRRRVPKKGCPFEDPQKSGHGEPILVYPGGLARDWQVQIIENKFPVFEHGGKCAVQMKRGPYPVKEGVGHHQLLITRDHDRGFPDLSKKEAALVFEAFQGHYRRLAQDECTQYVSIFHNRGPGAGASIYHPHYQIMAIPMIPSLVERSMAGAERYFKKNGECVHCMITKWEVKDKKRVVYEGDGVVAIAPFISKESFEVTIFPKKHFPYFEDTPREVVSEIAEALRCVLGSVEKRLGDPDYNFYFHHAPVVEKSRYDFYHWHIELLPRVGILSAGFELGTGIEITVVDPDDAAKVLRVKGR